MNATMESSASTLSLMPEGMLQCPGSYLSHHCPFLADPSGRASIPFISFVFLALLSAHIGPFFLLPRPFILSSLLSVVMVLRVVAVGLVELATRKLGEGSW